MKREQELKEMAKLGVKLSVERFILDEISRLDLERIKAKKEINKIEAQVYVLRAKIFNIKKLETVLTLEQIDIIKAKATEVKKLKAEMRPLVESQIMRKRTIGALRAMLIEFMSFVNHSPNAKLAKENEHFKKLYKTFNEKLSIVKEKLLSVENELNKLK